MLVGDLVYSDSVDFGCNYKIYDDLKDEGDRKFLFDARVDGRKPLDYILDMEVRYITVDREEGVILIGATQRR